MNYQKMEEETLMPAMPLSMAADDPKKKGMPDMDEEDEDDPHRGIADTPPQHEELVPDDEDEFDEDDFEDDDDELADDDLELDDDEEEE